MPNTVVHNSLKTNVTPSHALIFMLTLTPVQYQIKDQVNQQVTRFHVTPFHAFSRIMTIPSPGYATKLTYQSF